MSQQNVARPSFFTCSGLTFSNAEIEYSRHNLRAKRRRLFGEVHFFALRFYWMTSLHLSALKFGDVFSFLSYVYSITLRFFRDLMMTAPFFCEAVSSWSPSQSSVRQMVVIDNSRANRWWSITRRRAIIWPFVRFMAAPNALQGHQTWEVTCRYGFHIFRGVFCTTFNNLDTLCSIFAYNAVTGILSRFTSQMTRKSATENVR